MVEEIILKGENKPIGKTGEYENENNKMAKSLNMPKLI